MCQADNILLEGVVLYVTWSGVAGLLVCENYGEISRRVIEEQWNDRSCASSVGESMEPESLVAQHIR